MMLTILMDIQLLIREKTCRFEKGKQKMKLTKCDVCGEIKKNTNKIVYDDGSPECDVLVKTITGEYDNICHIEVDICRKCSIKILEQIKPRLTFMPFEQYKES